MQALTPRQLTSLHKAEQIRLASEGAAAIDQLWPMLDLDDRKRMSTYLSAVYGVAVDYRARSVEAAGLYLSAFGALHGEVVTPTAVATSPLVADRMRKAFRVLGPVSLRQSLLVMEREPAEVLTRRKIASAAVKAILDGGRDEVISTARKSPAITGWRRVVSPDACDFCVMHAARGAVFSAETATFSAHNNCSCAAEPAMRGGEGQRIEVDPYVAVGAKRKSNAGAWLRSNQKVIEQMRADESIYA